MPRGVKGSGTPKKARKSIDQRISELQATIQEKKDSIKSLEDQMKMLYEEKKREQTTEILNVLKDTGMTPEELLELAKSAKK
jgi:septal ring factor EnvC (AmiA/AmiB activator)